MSLKAGFSLTGRGSREALDRAATQRGLPKAVAVDLRARAHFPSTRRLGVSPWRQARLRPFRQAHGQRANRVVQRATARGVPEHARVRPDGRRTRQTPSLAPRRHPSPSPRLARSPDPERVRQNPVRSTRREVARLKLKTAQVRGERYRLPSGRPTGQAGGIVQAVVQAMRGASSLNQQG